MRGGRRRSNDVEERTFMTELERKQAANAIREIIDNLQESSGGWVEFARMGTPLAAAGVDYKQLGFAKLRPFLNTFDDMLAFRDEQAPGKPPVCYVRLREAGGASAEPKQPAAAAAASETEQSVPAERLDAESAQPFAAQGERVPTKDTQLRKWAAIPYGKYRELADLALEEKWYYGDDDEQARERLPILRNYLEYTFRRLSFENKVKIGTDAARGEEYAAFNTGLVDKKYEYIYALFKQNTLYRDRPYWYLLDFVVAGEDKGKTLVAVFNPLPERADYFEGKIQNMLYDTSTGDLSCDYTHIILERTYRFPVDFLEDNCPVDFLRVDGVSIEDVAEKDMNDPARRSYFLALGEKIGNTPRVLNRLKNRIEDAVHLALKRVEWNYKTAIPTYFPSRNTGSLLLPLCLVDEDRVDLALVVERTASGAYQGQTVLPLNQAYSNSRLVCRPDSDWLKTDTVEAFDADELDDDSL